MRRRRRAQPEPESFGPRSKCEAGSGKSERGQVQEEKDGAGAKGDAGLKESFFKKNLFCGNMFCRLRVEESRKERGLS